MVAGPCKQTERSPPTHCTTGRRMQLNERTRVGGKQTDEELVIKDERGRIVGKDSRGNDPRRIKG